MTEDRITRNLRHMAWERAKGELKSMLHTYWESPDKYEEMEKAIEELIDRVENEGLHE